MGKSKTVKKAQFAIFWIALMGVCILSATSVRLKNDTKNVLVAEVVSADGTPLSEETVPPFETKIWSYENMAMKKPLVNKSVTPLTVVWKTEKGDFYSSCSQVPSGAMVTAIQCRAQR